jgi:hypothetical protein
MFQMNSDVPINVWLDMKAVSCGTEECTFSWLCIAKSSVMRNKYRLMVSILVAETYVEK